MVGLCNYCFKVGELFILLAGQYRLACFHQDTADRATLYEASSQC